MPKQGSKRKRMESALGTIVTVCEGDSCNPGYNILAGPLVKMADRETRGQVNFYIRSNKDSLGKAYHRIHLKQIDLDDKEGVPTRIFVGETHALDAPAIYEVDAQSVMRVKYMQPVNGRKSISQTPNARLQKVNAEIDRQQKYLGDQ